MAGRKKNAEDEMELITMQEAAEIRGVSVAAISELVRRGRLEAVEKYGRKLVRRGDVTNFQQEKRGPKSRKSDN